MTLLETFNQKDELQILRAENMDLRLKLAALRQAQDYGLGPQLTLIDGFAMVAKQEVPTEIDYSQRSLVDKLPRLLPYIASDLSACNLLHGQTCLVVGEDDSSLELLKAALHDCKVFVIGVKSEQEAMIILENLRPDLIVSNLSRSLQEGCQMMRSLRQNSSEKCGDIPALALISAENSKASSQAIAAGFSRFAVAPLQARGLIEIVLELTKMFEE